MRYLILFFLLVLPGLCLAETAQDILKDGYGSFHTACTNDDDADTGVANAVSMPAGYRYVVYCHDDAGNYVSCRCLQGTSTVDAGTADGILITSPKMLYQRSGNTHISCVPFVDNQDIDVCRVN